VDAGRSPDFGQQDGDRQEDVQRSRVGR
jgi:hypothetical protein